MPPAMAIPGAESVDDSGVAQLGQLACDEALIEILSDQKIDDLSLPQQVVDMPADFLYRTEMTIHPLPKVYSGATYINVITGVEKDIAESAYLHLAGMRYIDIEQVTTAIFV